jgi:hypothetical protein
MTTVESTLSKIGFGAQKPQPAAWTVVAAGKKAAIPPRRSWLGVFQRREPSTYQRFLAVHIHYAGPRGGLS